MEHKKRVNWVAGIGIVLFLFGWALFSVLQDKNEKAAKEKKVDSGALVSAVEQVKPTVVQKTIEEQVRAVGRVAIEFNDVAGFSEDFNKFTIRHPTLKMVDHLERLSGGFTSGYILIFEEKSRFSD